MSWEYWNTPGDTSSVDSVRFGVSARPVGASVWQDILTPAATVQQIVAGVEITLPISISAGDSVDYEFTVWSERFGLVAPGGAPAVVRFLAPAAGNTPAANKNQDKHTITLQTGRIKWTKEFSDSSEEYFAKSVG